MCLERATIADRQGASEDQKFAAKPTKLNMTLFLANGVTKDLKNSVLRHGKFFLYSDLNFLNQNLNHYIVESRGFGVCQKM